ncbi:Demethylmacrocin O-methyltransferase [Phaeobacter sp. CECT 5382]|uniref:class I SAM-dependent methyltransferase n=1 Tax=Rhodobacterales TaxID=204455 RepID=UPI0006DA4FBC|nr:class I SAM-dependent methyltransferase [Phaeobacter sp. CECT 5382]CUH87092.1 Demethylmacrocin O-methyltransferase [Phaeobacter sp. CECT 5382]
MIGKYRFDGADVAKDIEDKYGFSGDLARIFVENAGPVVHKWHHYIPLYDRYFSRYRKRPLRFLEIGVSKGGSLQIWREYFGPEAIIFGIDIDPTCAQFDGQAGQVRIGSQDDPEFLKAVVAEMGGVDVVLDDGSHQMDHVAKSLEVLFPLLSEGGTYMIEDLHTAYWDQFGGGFRRNGNFFRKVALMVEDMHRWYHKRPVSFPILSEAVAGIHVHDSIVVLDKGQSYRPVHSRVGTR